MLQKGATEGIDVRVGVLDFADLSQQSWDGIEAFLRQCTDIITLYVFVRKLLQMDKPWVGVPQNCVTVPRHHPPLLQRLLHKLFNL
jgi:hypothetical protein